VSGEAFWAGEQASDTIPVFTGVLMKGRNLWEFKGKYHQVSDDELTPEDVKALSTSLLTRAGSSFRRHTRLTRWASSSARNLQLLCASCNRRKGATLG
jgi:hypothetical protein